MRAFCITKEITGEVFCGTVHFECSQTTIPVKADPWKHLTCVQLEEDTQV